MVSARLEQSTPKYGRKSRESMDTIESKEQAKEMIIAAMDYLFGTETEKSLYISLDKDDVGIRIDVPSWKMERL